MTGQRRLAVRSRLQSHAARQQIVTRNMDMARMAPARSASPSVPRHASRDGRRRHQTRSHKCQRHARAGPGTGAFDWHREASTGRWLLKSCRVIEANPARPAWRASASASSMPGKQPLCNAAGGARPSSVTSASPATGHVRAPVERVKTLPAASRRVRGRARRKRSGAAGKREGPATAGIDAGERRRRVRTRTAAD